MDEHSATVTTSRTSDLDTLSASETYEQNREQVRTSNPQGVTSHQSGVDVEKAENDFAELNRQFSNISHQARRLSQHVSKASKAPAISDIEKSGSSNDPDEAWDLETALRGNRAAEAEAGIRDKHIGK